MNDKSAWPRCCSILSRQEICANNIEQHETAYKKNLKECPQCGKEHTKPKFCSASCSATYSNLNRGGHSEATKKKMRENAINNPSGWAVNPNRFGSIKDPDKHKIVICPTCKSNFETLKSWPRTFCSNQCIKTGGYRKGAGNAKHGWYKNHWCDSSYELAFLIYCLDHNIPIERNKDFWLYENIDGNTRKYYPDFRVNGILTEIKGPKRPNDMLKINSVPEQVDYIQGNKNNQKYIDYVCSTYNVTPETVFTLYEDSRHMYNHTCQGCKKSFTSHRKNAIYCSQQCSGKYGGRKSPIRESNPFCSSLKD